jgi:TrmH family RNA methyltransferase
MTITSSHNQRLMEIRKLRMRRRERERSRRFVAEGEDLLAAADAAGWRPLERYCAAGSGLPGLEVEPKLLAQASGLGSGTRTLAVYEERWARRPAGPLCVYLHGVHDPGNVGAVLRSAQAFGASSVAIGPGSADPFGPKAVRASMGAVFSVALARAAAVESLPGFRIALVPGSGPPLAELWRGLEPPALGTPAEAGLRALPAEVTIMVGSERAGLPDEVVDAAHAHAQIPIRTQSLNASVAAAVALYELTRIRE